MEKYKSPYSSYVLSRPESPLGERFSKDCNSREQVLFYYTNRTIQGLCEGIRFVRFTSYEWGCCAVFRAESIKEDCYSIYIYASQRGKGFFSKWLAENKEKTIFTFAECDLENILAKKQHPYKSVTLPHTMWLEYQIICAFYGSHCAKRTSVLYINHIEEGLWILRKFNASEIAQRAYVMHPVFQTDDDLRESWERINMPCNENDLIHQIESKVIYLAIEYRNIANGYLSDAPEHENPKLSPIQEVNEMLIADKIQNRKDFEKYHVNSHPRSARLSQYFKQWLDLLQVTEEQYQESVKCIDSAVTPIQFHD